MRRLVTLIVAAAIVAGCGKIEPKHEVDSSPAPALDSNLAAALSQPEKATSLTFEDTSELERLPAELWTLTNLRELNLSCPENLKQVPPEIGRLRLLEKLVFDCGNGESMNISLPEEIAVLKNLTVLRLYGAMDQREAGQNTSRRAEFKGLPEAVRKLTTLKELDLGRNGLQFVPPQIASLENLEQLDLSFNEIHELPEFVGHLQYLRNLTLQGNGGVKFPESMTKRRGLKVIAGNNGLDLKAQASLREKYPGLTFDFENEFDDCSANEPIGGYPEWQKTSCQVESPKTVK